MDDYLYILYKLKRFTMKSHTNVLNLKFFVQFVPDPNKYLGPVFKVQNILNVLPISY